MLLRSARSLTLFAEYQRFREQRAHRPLLLLAGPPHPLVEQVDRNSTPSLAASPTFGMPTALVHDIAAASFPPSPSERSRCSRSFGVRVKGLDPSPDVIAASRQGRVSR
jgi:hypothetical protein